MPAQALYYDFKESNNMIYSIQEANKRNYNKWQKIADKPHFNIAKINNDTALRAFHLHQLCSVHFYIVRMGGYGKKQRLHPQTFLPRMVQHHHDTVEGKKRIL